MSARATFRRLPQQHSLTEEAQTEEKFVQVKGLGLLSFEELLYLDPRFIPENFLFTGRPVEDE